MISKPEIQVGTTANVSALYLLRRLLLQLALRLLPVGRLVALLPLPLFTLRRRAIHLTVHTKRPTFRKQASQKKKPAP